MLDVAAGIRRFLQIIIISRDCLVLVGRGWQSPANFHRVGVNTVTKIISKAPQSAAK